MKRSELDDHVQLVKSTLQPVGDKLSFKSIANGFFQSEGTVSARIRGLTISPIFVLVQNCVDSSLFFFNYKLN